MTEDFRIFAVGNLLLGVFAAIIALAVGLLYNLNISATLIACLSALVAVNIVGWISYGILTVSRAALRWKRIPATIAFTILTLGTWWLGHAAGFVWAVLAEAAYALFFDKSVPLSYNRRSIFARRLTTSLTVLGLGLVVFVFTAVLMLAEGFRKTLVSTGDASNVIFLRKGSTAELSSGVSRESTNIIKALSEAASTSDGKPLVTGELVVVNNLPRRADNQPSNVVVRGVSPESLILRDRVRIVKGRMWQPGTSEIITGKKVAERFKGCGMGESVEMGSRKWTVVGIFDANGSAFDSEIWGDADQFMDAFRRPVYSSLTMKMQDTTAFSAMKERLQSDPRLQVDIKKETQFYEDQSQGLGLFIKILGITVTIIFSFGAMTGAVITMYSAVANRSREIGTLRALGFQQRSILTSFLVECIFISLTGGFVGIILASLLQFIDVSTTNWTSFSEVVFGFNLTPGIITGSLIFSVIMGLIGGFAPAVRAARMQVVNALRAS